VKEKLKTMPEYCNTYSNPQATASAAAAPVTGISIGYKGQDLWSDRLILPQVVQSTSIQAGNLSSRQNWYADDRPDFSGLYFNVIVEHTAGAGYYRPTGGGTEILYQNIQVDASASYPIAYLEDINSQKKVAVYIGTAYSATTPAPNNFLATSFQVANYYRPTGIDFAGADWDLRPIFDDQTGDVTGSAIFTVLKAVNAKFTIYYSGGEPRTIDINKFLANNAWYLSQNLPTSTMYGGAGYGTNDGFIDVGPLNGGGAYGPADFKALKVDSDTEDWGVDLEYAPIANRPGSSPSVVNVRLPVYVFEELTSVTRKPGSNNPVLFVGTTSGTGAALADADRNSIRDRWQLNATYVRGRDSKTRAIDIQTDYLYLGMAGLVSNTSPGYWAGVHSGLTPAGSKEAEFKLDVVGLVTGGASNAMVARDYQLPVYYRRSYLTGEDTVLVDLRGRN
jgi:hypothetical protein